MGESVEEATITKWFVSEGDTVEEDDVLLEIATDKVDSEIPSPVAGKVSSIKFKEDDKVEVGQVIAIIDMDGEEGGEKEEEAAEEATAAEEEKEEKPAAEATAEEKEEKEKTEKEISRKTESDRFYSPLVRNIAQKENLSREELDRIEGSGRNGRVQKGDILKYIEDKKAGKVEAPGAEPEAAKAGEKKEAAPAAPKAAPSVSAGDEIVEMDRMRKMIAEHMIRSKQTSAHVTNMIEADVTNVVLWREQVKKTFQEREGMKLTFLPIFLEPIAKLLKEFPRINASVDGDKMILRKRINLGIAVALPNHNLIVPVIKDADQLNLIGMTRELNRLADAARNNKLNPDDIQGGTFSISNFGTFRNVMGTPVINQPQVAILAVGTIEKKPAVVETPTGDVIAIRHKMFLSLTYDHRIVDGALAGEFLRKLTDRLESFDVNRSL